MATDYGGYAATFTLPQRPIAQQLAATAARRGGHAAIGGDRNGYAPGAGGAAALARQPAHQRPARRQARPGQPPHGNYDARNLTGELQEPETARWQKDGGCSGHEMTVIALGRAGPAIPPAPGFQL